MAESVSQLGKYFRDTNVNPCDGEKIVVYNRSHDDVEADVARYLTYGPFCVGDEWGSTIDLAGWLDPMFEVFCIVLNEAAQAGTYTFYLYHEGKETFSFPVSLGQGWSGFWYAGNGEMPGNGNYEVKIKNPSGVIIATRSFTVVNHPIEVPECTQVFKIKDSVSGEELVVDNASVDGKTVSRVVTTYYVTIDKDGTYTLTATKAGYEALEESFPEDCPHLLTFYMEKKITYCNQAFKVIDKDTGATIPGVTIKLNEPPLTSCYTNSYGKCSITNLVVGWGLSVTVTKSGYVTGADSFTACTAERTIQLEKEITECEHTGYASPAKIELGKSEVPESSTEGETVNVKIVVDNTSWSRSDPTRYRVKFAWDDIVEYRDSFTLTGRDAWGGDIEQDVPYSFTMPNHGITLAVEIERCNAEGNWEPAGLEYKKDYPISVVPVVVCEYTGHAINAKIDHWNVPDNATEGETVTGWVKVDGDCYTPGQTTRGRVKFTLNGGTPEYSTVFTFDCFGETGEMPFSFVMPDHDVTLTAEVERCNEYGEWENAGPKYKKEFPITLRIAECEYTGHAINAKIDHWNVPDNATEGETVTGWVKVDGDCYTPGQTTRGRVKFTVNGGTPAYSTVFTFDCFGETGEMPFTFVMPDYDVTLTAEIERCNEYGEWENAGPKYKKDYTITLVEYEEAFGRIDREKTIPPYSAQKGDEIRIPTTIKNIGGTKGEFQMYLFDDTTNEEIEKEPCPRPLPCYWKDLNPDEEYSETLDTDWWPDAMPDHDWKLRIEVRKQTTPDVADDTYPFTVHLGGEAGHVIKLDKIPDTLIIGKEYTFTGNLTKEGEPVSDATVRIIDKDLLFGDLIVEGKTGADGRFAMSWTVEKIEKVVEIYAHHPDSDAKSSIQKVKIEEEIKIPTKLIIYGATTVGCYTAGSLMPEEVAGKKVKVLGTGLKVISIIPAALTAVEGYKLIKEKIPAWLK